MIKSILIGLSVLGSCAAVWTVATSNARPPQVPPDRPPARNPYANAIAAAGVVEAASRNVRVAAPEPGLIEQVFVDVGDSVTQGTPLFRLQTCVVAADLEQFRAAVAVAEANLDRLRALPREEDVAPLRASLDRTHSRQAEAKDEYERAKRLHTQGAATESELVRTRSAYEQAAANTREVQAQLDRILAGAWEQDVQVAESELQKARAEVSAIQARLDQRTVRSPIDGVVLKRYVEPGEYTLGAEAAALVVGDVSTLHIRVQVDENDAWLLSPGAPATAVLSCNELRECRLRMLRIEPLAVPKRHLSGANTELVDTRVVEAIFPVVSGDVPLFPGQLVDVYIEQARTKARVR